MKNIPEADVSLTTLRDALDAAFYDVTEPGPDVLGVELDGLRLMITVNESNKLVVVAAAFGLRGSADEYAKLSLANRINAKFILNRCAVQAPTTLLFDVAIPFAGGFNVAHLIHVLRTMQRVIPASLQEADTENVLGDDDDDEPPFLTDSPLH